MSLELCYLPATELLKKFRSKELSPLDVLDAQLARAEQTEPEVNCLSFKYFDQARDQAKKAEQAYAKGSARPLEGITITIKDEPMLEGYPTQNGSLLREGYVASYSDPICERVMSAGAIMHARSTTPEFSVHYCTWNYVTGVTRNPWNTDISVGGSSGGSGAALASGVTTLATGSDIGGSIRVPAAFNGVYGFKPPFGRVPELPPFSSERYAASGPLGRTLQDVTLLQQIISGPHEDDLYCLPAYELPSEHGSVKGMKIALCMDLGFYNVAQDVQDAIRQAVDVLRDQGAEVAEVKLNWDRERTFATISNHLAYEFGSVLRAEIEASGIDHDKLTPYVKYFALRDDPPTATDELEANLYSGEMLAELNRAVFANGFDALLCPTLATSDVAADYDPFSGDEVKIDGRAVDHWFDPVMTIAFNILGRFPVMNVPVGLSSIKVPIGMQIIGPKMEDRVPFAIANAYQSGSQWLFDAPPMA